MSHSHAALVASDVTWEAQPNLVPADGNAGDDFGISAAIDGDEALIGAWHHDAIVANQTTPITDAGSAYVWRRAAGKWLIEQELYASDAAPNQSFGQTVAISGNTAAVAAIDSDVGTVYLFDFDAGAGKWQQTARFSGHGADRFGFALSLRDNQLLIGAPFDGASVGDDAGAAYLSTRTGGSWSTPQLLPIQSSPGDLLGSAVALGAGIAAVGAQGHSSYAGLVWLLPLSDTMPPSSAVPLVPGDAQQSSFGSAVAFDPVTPTPNTLAVGASGYTDPTSQLSTGAVYTYAGSGTTWVQQQLLVPDEAQSADLVGASVALSSDVLLTTSPGWHLGNGAVYLFLKDGATWSEAPQLTGDINFEFGASAALTGRTALVGSLSFFQDPGQAEVLSLGLASHCNGDDDCALGHCSEGVCCDQACTDACHSCLKKFKQTGDDGTCGPVTADTDPREQCAEEAGDSCKTTGICDGSGACKLYPAGQPCGAVACTTANQVGIPECDGHGACISSAQNCGFFSCSQGKCATTCETNTGCIDNAYCDTSTATAVCKPIQPQSCTADAVATIAFDGTKTSCGSYRCAGDSCLTTCATNRDCADGFSCTEGVCCDQPCKGTCYSCLRARKGSGQDGTCGPIKEGQDPLVQCAEQTPASCGTTGSCDGAGSCALFPKGTECKATACSGPNTNASHACDGEGHCVDDDESCGLFQCANDQCTKHCDSASDCIDSAYCDTATGNCEPRQALKCSSDGTAAVSYDGVTQTSCLPFVCRDAQCLTSCRDTADCASPTDVCSNGACTQVQALDAPASSCALRRVSPREDFWAWGIPLGLLTTLARRRHSIRARRTLRQLTS